MIPYVRTWPYYLKRVNGKWKKRRGEGEGEGRGERGEGRGERGEGKGKGERGGEGDGREREGEGGREGEGRGRRVGVGERGRDERKYKIQGIMTLKNSSLPIVAAARSFNTKLYLSLSKKKKIQEYLKEDRRERGGRGEGEEE